MSIEKDVEKMYMKDIEKQNKNKKKKKKKLFTLLLVVIILAALFLLMNYLGLGLGGGKGEGGSSADGKESSSQAEVTTTTTTEAAKEYIYVQVSGSAYIYNGGIISAEDLAKTVELMSENVIVVIKDDNATKNAMDALTALFDADGRSYTIELLNADSSSEADASSAVQP